MRTLMGHDVLPHEALAAVSPVKSLEARRGMQTHSPVARLCCGKPPNSQTCRTEARQLAGSGGMAVCNGSRLPGRVRPATISTIGYADDL